MNLIESIIKDLITESALNPRIKDSIRKRYEVKISYDAQDGNPKGKGERVIQPVALGTSKSGNYLLRAFEPYGDTETKTPHWKLFRVDKITGWKPSYGRRFDEPPGFQYRSAEGKFNPNGDKTMANVELIANFEGAKTRYEKGGLKGYNKERQKQAVEKNPYYSLEKNIKNSSFITKDLKKNIQTNPEMQQWLQGQNFIDKNKETKPKKGNQSSIEDMAKANNFGDNKSVQTVEPIRKGYKETEQEPIENNVDNYTQAQNNGPKYKQEKDTEENERS